MEPCSSLTQRKIARGAGSWQQPCSSSGIAGANYGPGVAVCLMMVHQQKGGEVRRNSNGNRVPTEGAMQKKVATATYDLPAYTNRLVPREGPFSFVVNLDGLFANEHRFMSVVFTLMLVATANYAPDR
jgi:hypothetical protein